MNDDDDDEERDEKTWDENVRSPRDRGRCAPSSRPPTLLIRMTRGLSEISLCSRALALLQSPCLPSAFTSIEFRWVWRTSNASALIIRWTARVPHTLRASKSRSSSWLIPPLLILPGRCVRVVYSRLLSTFLLRFDARVGVENA